MTIKLKHFFQNPRIKIEIKGGSISEIWLDKGNFKCNYLEEKSCYIE